MTNVSSTNPLRRYRPAMRQQLADSGGWFARVACERVLPSDWRLPDGSLSFRQAVGQCPNGMTPPFRYQPLSLGVPTIGAGSTAGTQTWPHQLPLQVHCRHRILGRHWPLLAECTHAASRHKAAAPRLNPRSPEARPRPAPAGPAGRHWSGRTGRTGRRGRSGRRNPVARGCPWSGPTTPVTGTDRS